MLKKYIEGISFLFFLGRNREMKDCKLKYEGLLCFVTTATTFMLFCCQQKREGDRKAKCNYARIGKAVVQQCATRRFCP
jgi:hypothetical protein